MDKFGITLCSKVFPYRLDIRSKGRSNQDSFDEEVSEVVLPTGIQSINF
jgi:hypothetical protein